MISIDAFETTDVLGGEFEWSDVSEWELRYSCFTGDIELKLDDVDFSTHWGWVPILDFALGLIDLIGESDNPDVRVFEFTESEATMRLKREGEMAVLTASYAPGIMRLKFEDLEAAARDLGTRVSSKLASEHRGLTENVHFLRMLRSSGIE